MIMMEALQAINLPYGKIGIAIFFVDLFRHIGIKILGVKNNFDQ